MTQKIFIAAMIVLLSATTVSGIAFAQSTIVEDTTALITSMGALMGALGGIVIAVVGFVANKTKGTALEGKISATLGDLMKVGTSLQQTDQWIKENQGQFVGAIEALSEVPAVKTALESKHLEIKKLRDNLEKATDELNSVYATVIPKI